MTSEQEINETIAEYMGYRLREGYKDRWYLPSYGTMPIINYTQSLDALIPVVEKLDICYVLFWEKGLWWAGYLPGNEVDLEYIEDQYSAKSPSLALATALATVIKETK